MPCSIQQIVIIFTVGSMGAAFSIMLNDTIRNIISKKSIFSLMKEILLRGIFSLFLGVILSAYFFNGDCFMGSMISGLAGLIGNKDLLELVKIKFTGERLDKKEDKKDIEDVRVLTLERTNFVLQNLNIKCKYLFNDEYHNGTITSISLEEFTLENGFSKLKSLREEIIVDFKGNSLPLDKSLKCNIKSNSNNKLVLYFPELTELQKYELLEWIIFRAVAIVNKLS